MLPSAEHTPPGAKNPKTFFGGRADFGAFFGGRNRVFRAPGAFGGVERSIWGAKRPGLTRVCPDLPRKWAITAPVLPRKHLVLATMLWSAVDGMAVFPRSLARDLHAGCSFNAEACPESRRAGIERDAEHAEGGLGNGLPEGLRGGGKSVWRPPDFHPSVSPRRAEASAYHAPCLTPLDIGGQTRVALRLMEATVGFRPGCLSIRPARSAYCARHISATW